MDAFVQLALIEKAKRVFAADSGVMLSFPLLAPVSFTPPELAAIAAPVTAADYTAAGEFARTVNFLPTDIVASMTERLLWDVYGDVLARGEVGDATSADGKAAQDAVAKAVALLYETAADGTRVVTVESEAMKRYRQYRDAWFVARENYAVHKLTGEMSQDPAEQQHWREVDEPAFRGAVDAASSAWDTLGGRTVIEAALQVERDAATNDPRRRWAEWGQAFNPDLDLVSEASGGHYAPTGLSPQNFVDQEWLTFDLSASEMRTLVDEAPEALKRVLDDDAGSGIDRVTFEYRSVALVRPWFEPEVLTSGVWRSAEADLQLSDGGTPPKGVCPAYASACVFVRNVQVTEQGASTAQVRPDLRFTLDPKLLTLRRDLLVDPGIAARLHRRETQTEVVTAVTPPAAFRVLQRSTFTQLAGMHRVLASPAGPPPRLTGRILPPLTLGRLRDVLDVPDPVRATASPPPVPEPSQAVPEPSAPSTANDQISILAFICKLLPAAPASSRDLEWGLGGHPFPLPKGHMFGSPASKVLHDGKANATDHENVRTLQEQLNRLGHTVTADGWLGKESDKAIRRFQSAHHLAVDGHVGPVTWAALWT
jgi:hypothetical protein